MVVFYRGKKDGYERYMFGVFCLLRDYLEEFIICFFYL